MTIRTPRSKGNQVNIPDSGLWILAVTLAMLGDWRQRVREELSFLFNSLYEMTPESH